MILKYKIHCNTENADKIWYLDNNQSSPTTCPTNSSHSVDLSSTAVVQIGGPQEVIQVLGKDNLLLSPRGMIFNPTAGRTTSSDLKFDTDLVLRGGVLFSENAVVGDYIGVDIIDKDNVTGQGGTPDNPTILGSYVKKWCVMPGVVNSVVDISVTSIIPSGLYLRVNYTSVGQTNPTVALNLICYVQSG